jgi:hypothetical protein
MRLLASLLLAVLVWIALLLTVLACCSSFASRCRVAPLLRATVLFLAPCLLLSTLLRPSYLTPLYLLVH